jgi:hypothetical protein
VDRHLAPETDAAGTLTIPPQQRQVVEVHEHGVQRLGADRGRRHDDLAARHNQLLTLHRPWNGKPSRQILGAKQESGHVSVGGRDISSPQNGFRRFQKRQERHGLPAAGAKDARHHFQHSRGLDLWQEDAVES